MPGDDAHDPGTIARGAGERADIVGREGERHHAVAADTRLRRLDPAHPVRSGGKTDRPAGVRSQCREGETGGDRRTRSTGGAAGDIRKIPGIAAIAVMTIVAGAVLRELRHVEAGKRISAGSAEPPVWNRGDPGTPVLTCGRVAFCR